MLSKGFKIVSPKTFEIYYEDVELKEGYVLVKIDFAAICKADLRYFLGKRQKRVLGLKYPMRLLHEATGTVIKDYSGKFKIGDRVVLVPNIVQCHVDGSCPLGYENHMEKECSKCYIKKHEELGENFCPVAKFASSNKDGFSCEYISFPSSNVIPIGDIEPTKAVFAELTSVGLAAIRRIKEPLSDKTVAVFGDGIVGYIISSIISNTTNCKVIVVGKHEEKISLFPCHRHYIAEDELKIDEEIDIAFECVGSKAAESAINQIIDRIKIGGTAVLTGVSEENIMINTRKILEKGITITGTTRSNVKDFEKSIELMNNSGYNSSLEKLVRQVRTIKTISDYYSVFEDEARNKNMGKILMEFHI
ncbi:ribitol-5-phosphate 2-dehydrogenase [Hathewaya proteolytica DSM 3090]|uniref:Ribitol-5-phosphate 2-dehydrogenase n=1 Tax=Hathewaya proteolytica DSM 3090 TaxID=1121331 RepID=A0A1M6PT40_9CLOT|nr:alcohol dehydrogenase catalytic domain-containing protein [Hathewaya proteolytica]SHK11060.1 ribitol-5-phosphate 2-dehydrogenase [Hathewaya proteolytica DSM 3090]